jgi:hypothetical protein
VKLKFKKSFLDCEFFSQIFNVVHRASTMPGNYLLLYIFVIALTLHTAQTHTQGFPFYDQPPAFLTSGIMYQDVTPTADEPILVNPNFISFKRTLDLSPLAVVLNQLKEATQLYTELCFNTTHEIDRVRLSEAATTKIPATSDIPNHKYPQDFFVPKERVKMGEAVDLCKKYNATLPEVRSVDTFDSVKHQMIVHALDLIPCGIMFDENTHILRFMTDNITIATTREFIKEYRYSLYGYTTDNDNDKTMLNHARGFNVGCEQFGSNQYRVKIFHQNDMNWVQRVVCQAPRLPVAAQQHGTDNFIKFVCKRDPDYYTKTVDTLYQQAEMLFNISGLLTNLHTRQRLPKSVDSNEEIDFQPADYKFFVQNSTKSSVVTNEEFNRAMYEKIKHTVDHSKHVLSNDGEDLDIIFSKIQPHKNPMVDSSDVDAPHSRHKRFGIIPAVVAGGATILAGSNVAHSFINGGPMFSWAGGALARLFGWATSDQIQQQGEALLAVSAKLDDLTINVEVVADQLKAQRDALIELQTYLQKSEISLMNYFRLTDLAQQLQTIILNTQISIDNLMTMLSDVLLGQWTPSLLAPSELNQLKAEMLIKHKLNIDITFKHIETNVVVHENNYHLILTMPLIEQSEAARLYKISTLPVYLNKIAYRADIDATNIAIFSGNVEYSVLTDEEMQICRSEPTNCRVAGLKHSYSDKSLCVVKTFKVRNAHCGVHPTNETAPFFELHRNLLIFSVAQPMEIATDCVDAKGNNVNNAFTIQDVGQVAVPPGCVLSTGNGKIRTLPAPKQVALTDSALFQVISQIPDIRVPPMKELQPAEKSIFQEIPDFQLKPMDNTNITALIISSFQPGNVISFGVKFAIAFGIIFLVLSCCCICNRTCRVWFTSCIMIRPMQPWWQKANKMADRPSGKISRLIAEYRRKAAKQKFEEEIEAEFKEAMNNRPIIREPPPTPPRPSSPLYLQMSPSLEPRVTFQSENNSNKEMTTFVRPPTSERPPHFWASTTKRPRKQQQQLQQKRVMRQVSPPPIETPPPRYASSSYPPLPEDDPTRTAAEQIIYDTTKMAAQMDQKMAVLHEEVKEVDQLLASYRMQQMEDGCQDPLPALPSLAQMATFDRLRPEHQRLPSPATGGSMSSMDTFGEASAPTQLHVQFAPQPPAPVDPLSPRMPNLPLTRPTTLQLQYKITDTQL